jgi:hypothetical protein
VRSAKIWIPAAALVAILVVVIGVVGFGQETSATVSFSNDIMPMFLASCAAVPQLRGSARGSQPGDQRVGEHRRGRVHARRAAHGFT